MQAPWALQVSAPLQRLPSLQLDPTAVREWLHEPSTLQLSLVQGFWSAHDAAVQVKKPSWKVREVPVAASTSRPRNAPDATTLVSKKSVPFGTRTSAVTWFPVPKEADFGVAVRAPVVPFCPDISIRIPRALRVAPEAGPMKPPLPLLNRLAMRN
jgi:hypothetical protein